MKKKLLLLALAISALFTNNLNAQVAGDFQSAGSGSWNSTSTWARYDGTTWVTPAPSFPTTAEGPVTVLAGHVVDITANISLDSVTIATGATVNINAGVTVTAPTNNAGGAINDINNQGTLNVSGKILATGTGLVKTSGGTTTFMSGSTYEHAENGGSIPMSTWNPGSTCLINAVVANYPSNCNQSFHDFTWNCSSQTAASSNLGWHGNIVTGTVKIISTGTTGQFRFTNSGANPSGAVSFEINNLEVNGGIVTSSGSGTAQTYNIIVNGNILVTGGLLRLSSSNGVTAIWNLKGNLTLPNSTGTFLNASSTASKIVFNKIGTQSISSFATSSVYAGTITIDVESGSMVNLGESNLGASTGIFTVKAGGGITTSHANGFNGNFTSGTQTLSFSTLGNYGFNGTTIQSTGSKFALAVSACNNLIVSNSGGTGNDSLKLSGNLKVNGNLTLSSGIILPSTTNTLTLGTTATVTGGSNASHVAKRLFRETDNTVPYLFPIGKGGYNPLTVIPQSTAPTTFEAEYYNTAYTDVSTFTAPATAVTTNGYHDLGRTIGTADAKVQLTLAGLGVPGGTAASSVGLGHYTGGSWKWENGFGVVDGSATTGTVESGVVSTFSPFGLVLVPAGTLSALPLNLLSFAGKLNNNQVDLNWLTTNEINTKEFSIERSTNGKSFTSIGNINAANTSGNNTYNFTDTKASGNDVLYYRLKQIDVDGAFTYSNIVVIKIKNTKQLIAFPNPASKAVSIAYNTAAKNTFLMVYNSVGALISKSIVATGSTQTNVDVTTFANGTYQFVITDGTNTQKTQVVKIY